jgi:hypothetical protein
MRRNICILSVLCLAAMATTQTCPAQTEELQTNAEEKSTERSESAEPARRDPFSPVGYRPGPKVDPLVQARKIEQTEIEQERLARSWNEAQARLTVAGLSRMGDEGYFAIVNGKMLRAGDTVSIDTEDGSFHWRVEEIGKEGIKLKRIRAEMKQR